ncbi:hypothetical protein CEXT_436921 [Caerostris extrusa]|uniref:Secreted protein n=1 Tax=Caerostris extrusa TaxID=172846 RepID=A0AAV4XGE9_CAEEX|nr:hypothetical protein CEXT_436921 [Caerostris extrusa]
MSELCLRSSTHAASRSTHVAACVLWSATTGFRFESLVRFQVLFQIAFHPPRPIRRNKGKKKLEKSILSILPLRDSGKTGKTGSGVLLFSRRAWDPGGIFP